MDRNISLRFKKAIRNYVMTDADIARHSADGDGFLIISGDGDASLNVEVQEDIVALKVGDEEEKSSREEVNMDELADMLNGDDVQAEQEDEEKSVEPEPEGEVVTEEHIAEVKVGGVEAGVSIQWPGGEEEQTEETAADNDETEKVEETEEVGESEKIEDEYVHVGEDEETQKQGEVLIDVQLNGEAAEEIIEEIKDEVNVEEEAETPAEPEIPAEPDTPAEPEIPAEPDTPAEVETPAEEEVVENKKEEEEDEERPVGNVAIEITLGETAEEKKEEKEEVTEKVPHVRHGRVAKNLSDRIRAFESKNKDDIDFSPEKSGAMDEIAATEAQTTESTPVIRDDLVRSSDTIDDKKSVEGGTKSLLERFKQGSVSNVEIKRTIDEEHVSVRSLENYQPPPREEEEDTHVKPQDMIDTDRDAGQSAESEPQEIKADVVRSNQDFEEVRSSVGLKNLKSMFEKGGVSNVEVRVQREKIEVKPLGEVEDTEAKAVAENVPQSQKADVVSGGAQEEDPGIKLGLAQKMRAQFEKGNVSNIEEKPRPDLERTPKSLDDFADEQSAQASQSVSESTPQRRDDVVRSDIPLEEQSHLAEGTRSLLSRWEKGEVEHAEEKPKESLSEPKDFKDVIQVSESTPQVRDDLVRETDQLDESIPEGFTKNLAGNLEGGAEFSVEVGVHESVEDEEDEESNRIAEGDDNPEIQVSIEVNGNVSPGENGLESTLNGHYENDEESPEADPSLEIKAARAAALEQDEDDNTMLVDSR